MSKVDIDSSRDTLYMVTWEYDASTLFGSRSKKKGWQEEITVTKNENVFKRLYQGLTTPPTVVSFRNVRAFIMKAEEVFP